MKPHYSVVLGLSLVCAMALVSGCRRTTSEHGAPDASFSESSVAKVPTAPLFATGQPGALVAPSASASDSDQTRRRIETRNPVVLDDAAKAKATQYLGALSRARRATVKKDYVAAEKYFTTCLELLPNDARALAERGYARLLQDKLDEAEVDFKLAEANAAQSLLRQQILFNQMQIAKKRGDEKRASELEKRVAALKAGRHVEAGLSCEIEVTREAQMPQRFDTLAEVWAAAIRAHAKDAKPTDFSLGEEPVTADISEAELWKRLTHNAPRGDGAFSFSTTISWGSAGHVFFARKGKYYLHAGLGEWQNGRCPSGNSEPVVSGGKGAEPLNITYEGATNNIRYVCEYPNQKTADCDGGDEGVPVQSYCSWGGIERTTLILDAVTLETLVAVSGGVSTDYKRFLGNQPEVAFELEFQPTQMVITGCGKRRVEPYQLLVP